MFKRLIALAIGLFMLTATVAHAQEPTPEQLKAFNDKMAAIEAGLKPQRGAVRLPGAKATLDLGKDYYFLGAADAEKVLVDGWGNPKGSADGVLGIVFPEGKTFKDDTWGAVVSYKKTHYVPDTDAASQDYEQVLTDMRAGEGEENSMREKDGFPSSHLVGWAQPPTYDAARHDLIWARDIQFGTDTDHTLNYDVRHLGRYGVLSINLVTAMSQLQGTRPAAAALAKTAEFDAGARYADFKKGDKTAGYGLAGLVAAGAGLAVAKKAGLIAILIIVLKKAGVFIIAGLAGAGAWFKRLFGRKKSEQPDQAPQNPGRDIVE